MAKIDSTAVAAAAPAAAARPAAEPPEEVPQDVTFGDVAAASLRIRPGVARTALARSRKLSAALGCEVYLKAEYAHPTGSFKERGARNALLLPLSRLSASMSRAAGLPAEQSQPAAPDGGGDDAPPAMPQAASAMATALRAIARRRLEALLPRPDSDASKDA